MNETLYTAWRDRLLTLPGVEAGTSRFSAEPAFTLHKTEFAHVHPDGSLDLRVPKAVQKTVKGDPRVTFRPNASDWIECRLQAPEDLALASMLAEAGYQAVRAKLMGEAGLNI